MPPYDLKRRAARLTSNRPTQLYMDSIGKNYLKVNRKCFTSSALWTR
jgi:hypothetical protein